MTYDITTPGLIFTAPLLHDEDDVCITQAMRCYRRDGFRRRYFLFSPPLLFLPWTDRPLKISPGDFEISFRGVWNPMMAYEMYLFLSNEPHLDFAVPRPWLYLFFSANLQSMGPALLCFPLVTHLHLHGSRRYLLYLLLSNFTSLIFLV